MFALRWLNGPTPGQVFEIKEGTNILGRSDECQIKILDKGISKQHAQLQLLDGKVFIRDLKSTNGVFVNGVRTQQARLNVGDKVLLHQCLFDVVELKKTAVMQQPRSEYHSHGKPALPPEFLRDMPHVAQGATAQSQTSDEASTPSASTTASVGNNLNFSKVDDYISRVVMPGFYGLAESFELKFILGGAVGIYILLVTVLATFPMLEVTKTSVETESQRRALSLARQLQARNQIAINQNSENALDADLSREEGVKSALIVSASDGHILAPATRLGRVDSTPFIHAARKKDAEMVSTIDSSTIGAAVPIRSYNPETGVQSVLAYSIIIYDMGSLAVDNGRVLSLFIQVLAIALALGFVLFFVLFRLIEYPLRSLNEQLDQALKDNGQYDIKTRYQFPALEELAANINSALTRISSGSGGGFGGGETAAVSLQLIELENLARLIPGGLLIFDVHSNTIQSVNPQFENLTGLGLNAVQGQPLDVISDGSLRENIRELLGKSLQHVGAPASDYLEIGGVYYDLTSQALSVGGHASHVIICLRAREAA
jgi:hypothetical protein